MSKPTYGPGHPAPLGFQFALGGRKGVYWRGQDRQEECLTDQLFNQIEICRWGIPVSSDNRISVRSSLTRVPLKETPGKASSRSSGKPSPQGTESGTFLKPNSFKISMALARLTIGPINRISIVSVWCFLVCSDINNPNQFGFFIQDLPNGYIRRVPLFLIWGHNTHLFLDKWPPRLFLGQIAIR
jgi:hypothetical protein